MPLGPLLMTKKENLQFRQKRAWNCKICELFHFGPFGHFHSDRLKTHVPWSNDQNYNKDPLSNHLTT